MKWNFFYYVSLIGLYLDGVIPKVHAIPSLHVLDFQVGIKAFLEKKKPTFKGK